MGAPVVTGWDLATRRSGWCCGAGEAFPTTGAILLPQLGADIGQMLDLFDRAANRHVDEFGGDYWIKEAAIAPAQGQRGDRGAVFGSREQRQKLWAVNSHLELVAYRRGICCEETSLESIKRELTGNPRAEKAAMVAVCERLGVHLPETKEGGREDAADAFGAWLIGLRHYAKSASREWDRRLYGRRPGALL